MAKTHGSVWDAAPAGMKRPEPVAWDEATAPPPPVPEPPPAPRWVAVDPEPVRQTTFHIPSPPSPTWVEARVTRVPSPSQRPAPERVRGEAYDAVWVDEAPGFSGISRSTAPPAPQPSSMSDRIEALARTYGWQGSTEVAWPDPEPGFWRLLEENS